ncbi:MAG: hypothetical protein IKG27_04690 [Bacilli bacterium]|nr:hypothetical protein [Bacilli bacterium]
MILRKPYALFIKYFKLLHVIMAAFISFTLYRSFVLYRFFDAYSIDYRSAVSSFNGGRLGLLNYIFVFIVLILTGIFLAVSIYKNKPKKAYIYNLILYIGVFVLYYLSSDALFNIQNVILDIKVSKAFRDISLIVVIFQVLSFIMTVVRATGFDIKQFDFGTDLQQMDISTQDNEEFEVAVEFNKDKIIRDLKRNLRNLKYFYFEHRFIINTVLIIAVLAISASVYFSVGNSAIRYSEGDTFTADSATINVKDSYILNSSINGDNLVSVKGDNAGAIVLIRFQAKGYKVNQTFNTGIVTLNIGNFSYSENVNHAVELYDLGTAYVNQKLTDEFKTYTLAFEIPDALSKKKMVLSYKGTFGEKTVLVSLKPADLRKQGELFEKRLTETIDFSDSILGSSSLMIDKYEIDNKFKFDYKFCYGKDKCIDSHEFITPTATGNYFKTLMRISGKIIIDKNNNIKDIYDLRTLLNNYGTIVYKVNDVAYSQKIDSEELKTNNSKTDDYFIEIPYDVKEAKEISLILKIRNQSYKYVLK